MDSVDIRNALLIYFLCDCLFLLTCYFAKQLKLKEKHMPGIFRVEDFGAIAGDGTDDRAAIQAALDAAANAGGGTVVLSAGVYDLTGTPGNASLGCLQIRSNTTLEGAGMEINGGGTVLRLMDGYSGGITGIIRTPVKQVTDNVVIKDLTIDGNRANTTGKVDAFFCGVLPGDPRHCSNITVDGVEAKNCSGYGFDPHEQTHNLVIQNSVSHGHGLDGFVADYITGGLFLNNIAFDNDRHGFNIVTSTRNFLAQDNVSYGNGSTGLVVQRGTDNVAWPTDITIQGGAYYDNANEGMLLKMVNDITVKWVDIYGNGKHGLFLAGATNNHITESSIFNNSQAINGFYDEVRVSLYNDTNGSSGQTYISNNNLIDHSLIFSDGLIESRYGVQEVKDGTTNTRVLNNNIFGAKLAAVALASASSFTNGFDDAGTTVSGPVITGGMENDSLTGTAGNDIMYGGNGNDTISASGGNDLLIGGLGADTLIGGLGDDTYYVDNIGDVVTEKSSSGNDTIYASVNFTMNSNMETLVMLDGAIEGKGSSNNNTIIGNAANNSLNGGSGNDRLFGMDGNDYISGGTGNDFIEGGNGNDDLRGGDGNDTVNGGDGVDQLYGGIGSDTFIFEALTDSGVSVWSDLDAIRDFRISESDRIDLSALGSLTFISNSSFSNSGQGQVNYQFKGSHTIVGIDADGNSAADMEFAVIGHVALTENEFIFV
jgi:Ca2+-binding RTX toxin-like protein